MRRTYSYSSIIIGVLVALLVYASTNNIALTILALVGVSVVGFILIRFLEKLLYKAADKGVDAVQKAIQNRKNNKDQ